MTNRYAFVGVPCDIEAKPIDEVKPGTVLIKKLTDEKAHRKPARGREKE